MGDSPKLHSTRRLGKRELGPYAFETRMPDKIYNLIAQETNKNRLQGLIPALGQLLLQDKRVDRAFLCRDAIEHIYPIKGEGQHFCGYRNILMLLSELDPQVKASLPHATQTILDIQSLVERAWDIGYDSESRIATGGIKNTRKHIGTTEARALLQSLNISCEANVFTNSPGNQKAYKQLLDYVENYFSTSISSSDSIKTKIHQTPLPSIYLQRPRHSLTIVGLEKRHDGSRALLVFDPAYSPPADVERALQQGKAFKHRKSDLRTYRRGAWYLRRFARFEILHVDYVATNPQSTT